MTYEQYLAQSTAVLKELMALEGMVFCKTCTEPAYETVCLACKDKIKQEVA